MPASGGGRLTLAFGLLPHCAAHAGGPRESGVRVQLGLVVGLVWPFTLWIVIGFWWHWCGRPDPRAKAAISAQLQQARGFAEQAEREGMLTSEAHSESRKRTA